MKTLQYDGQTVYTHATRDLGVEELERFQQKEGTIEESYFFRLTPDRNMEPIEFNKYLIEKNESGLNVRVKDSLGSIAGVSIAGLDNILEFLSETDAVGDLKKLEGMKVTQYGDFMCLYGISIPKEE